MMRIAWVCLAGSLLAASACRAEDAAPKPFEIDGMYVEGCTCEAPCPCELTGVQMGCQGVGAFRFEKASYDGVAFDGVAFAYAVEPGKWVRLFIDAKDAKQKEAVIAFAKAALKAFGPVEAVADAKVEITGADGKYTATVDGGKIFTLTTEPVLGGDGKEPLTYSNIHDVVHPTVMQAKVVGCEYNDGTHTFKLEGSNAYFNAKLKVSGKM